MLPLGGVFVVAAVAGFGATVGHKLARDVVLPWMGETASNWGRGWDSLGRMAEENRRRPYDDFAAPSETEPSGTG